MKNKFFITLFIVDVTLSSLLLFVFRHASVFHGYGDHLSNFALSIFIVFTAGSVVVVRHKPFYVVGIIAGILIAANIIVELLIRYMNTPDLKDAAFGIAGVCIAYGLLALLKKLVSQPAIKRK